MPVTTPYLDGLLEVDMKVNEHLRNHWANAKEWSEQARYEIWTQERASAILDDRFHEICVLEPMVW